MVEIASLAAIAALAKQGVEVLGGAVGIYDKIKGTKAEEDPEGLKKLAGELAEELFKARMKQLEIQTALQELQLQAAAEERFAAIRARYTVRTLPAGGRILTLRDGEDQDENYGAVCPTCVEKAGKFIPLQGGPEHFELECTNCGSEYPNVSRAEGWNLTTE